MSDYIEFVMTNVNVNGILTMNTVFIPVACTSQSIVLSDLILHLRAKVKNASARELCAGVSLSL